MKRFIVIGLFLLLMMSAACVSAADNITDDDSDDIAQNDYEIIVTDDADNLYCKDAEAVVAEIELPQDASGELEAYEGTVNMGKLIASAPLTNGYGQLRLSDLKFADLSESAHFVTFAYGGSDYIVEDYPTFLTLTDYELKVPKEVCFAQNLSLVMNLHADVTDYLTLSEFEEDDEDRFYGDLQYFEITDGISEMTLENLTMGLHSFTVTYQSNGYDINRDISVFIYPDIITKDSLKIGIDPVVTLKMPEDACGTFTLTLYSEKLDDEIELTCDYEGGDVTFSSLGLTPGRWQITGYQIEDDEYGYASFDESPLSDSNEGIFTLFDAAYPKDVTIKPQSSQTVYADTYKVKITADGKALKGITATVKINGKKYKTLKTDKNGYVAFKITKNPGKYNVAVTALGKTVTKKLTVKHIVTLKGFTVKRSAKKLVLTASLSKIGGKYLKGKTVTFKFNGKKYAAKTSKKGVAKVTVPKSDVNKLKVGKTVTIKATYLKDTVRKSIKVKK